jgi:rhodanese-related sulfurtransferase
VAQVFEEHGFKDAHPLIGGYEAWKMAGLPIEPRRAGHQKVQGGLS